MKTALFIGRFQPLHKGHLHALKKAKKKYRLHIGIGSANKSGTPQNPLPADQREKIIKNCIKNTPILHLPDFQNDSDWTDNVEQLIDFDIVISGNDHVRRLMQARNHPVYPPSFLKKHLYSGTEIRRRIVEGKDWKHLVPHCALHLLRELRFADKVRTAHTNDR